MRRLLQDQAVRITLLAERAHATRPVLVEVIRGSVSPVDRLNVRNANSGP